MSAGFHDHFSAFASKYADFRPHYPAPLFDYLATLSPNASLVWDCAAGNGQATIDLVTRFGRIVATDASKEQIASAIPHPNIDYRVAPAEESGLESNSVELITVAQALHWFNLDRFYAEADRVLKPGGVLAAFAYGINTVEGDKINQLVWEYYSEIVGPYWPPERKLVEEGYRTIPFPFTELQPPLFRMEACWTLEQLLGYFSTWSATNRYIKAKGTNPIEPLAAALGAAWGDGSFARLIEWPLAVRVSRKA